MYELFYQNGSFNEDIGSWDVSNVTDMNYMFYQAESFNQDISQWDVSNVTNMGTMFGGASSFNRNLSTWNVDNVTRCYAFCSGTNWSSPKPGFKNNCIDQTAGGTTPLLPMKKQAEDLFSSLISSINTSLQNESNDDW